MKEIVNRLTGEVVVLGDGQNPSREQAIAEFVSADERYKVARDMLAVYKAQLLPHTEGVIPEGRKSGFMEGTDGVRLEIKVVDKSTYDTAVLTEAAGVLGEKFEELFKVETKYTAKKRALNKWLATQSSSPDENKAREIIRNAHIEPDVQPIPYIKVVGARG